MKYIVEITKDKMVKKFIDDNGIEFVNTWVDKGCGVTQTLETALDQQMEHFGEYDDELLDAIYDENIDDIWKAIRNS